MVVDEKLLKRLETLSQLKIDEGAREECIEQLGKIVSFVENLSTVDTSSIDSNFALNDNATKLREDDPISSLGISDDILKNAPDAQESYFIVPKIVE